MVNTLIYFACVGVVLMLASVGVLLVWATKFDKHIKKQSEEREEDG